MLKYYKSTIFVGRGFKCPVLTGLSGQGKFFNQDQAKKKIAAGATI